MSGSLAQLLLSCLAGNRLRRVLPVAHACTVVLGALPDLFLANLLLRGYSNLGRLRDARRLFDRMPGRNLVSWGSAISMYVQHGREEDALALFITFLSAAASEGEAPKEFLLTSALMACAQSRAVCFGEQVHGVTAKLGLDANVFVGTTLVNLYAKAGRIDAAMSVFNVHPARNPVTWTAVITGYSQAWRAGVALELFAKMGLNGIRLDRFVLASAASACSALGFVEGGRQILGYAYRTAAESDASVVNALINLY